MFTKTLLRARNLLSPVPTGATLFPSHFIASPALTQTIKVSVTTRSKVV